MIFPFITISALNLELIIIGNKTDIRRKSNAHLRTTQAKNYVAKHYKSPYLETSAKTGKNVIKAFELIATELVKGIPEHLL